MIWSVKNDYCISCNSTIYPHKGKGLCSKCYRVYKEFENLDKADEIDIEKFIYKYIPFSKDRSELKSQTLNAQKEQIKIAIENRKLRYLKWYGQIETGSANADILKLEMILNDLAFKILRNNDLYTGKLLYFNTRFNEEQRKIIILKLLLMLV